jgi:CubicO group peptidase (beta-lactamase class C family)
MSNTIREAMEAYVTAGKLPGVATLIWRDGRVVEAGAVGYRDAETGAKLTRDSIFRIASMSKPVTSLAAMMLWEEGRFALDEPISRWAPEFKAMQVLTRPGGPMGETVPADREITFEDLLTHRSGITYGDLQSGPLQKAYEGACGGDIDSLKPPADWIAGLASLPLVAQPGKGFNYGHSTDLLGLLIGRMEGASLGTVLKRRLFEPLGMTDTGFVVRPEARMRRAQLYGFSADGKRLAKPLGNSGVSAALLAERPANLGFESGGQGLWSTLDDYLKFARLFVEGGSIEGIRLLNPETIAMMCANRLSAQQRTAAKILGSSQFVGHGFGLGVAVVLDPEKADTIRCKGGVGTVGWPGAFGGWWQADPTDGSVLIFLTHNLLDLELLTIGYGLAAFTAQMEFHRLAKRQT